MRITTPTMAKKADEVSRLDAVTITARLAPALALIDQSMAGFPTGLDAGPGDADDVDLTTVERLALTPDKARAAQDRIFALLAQRMTLEGELASLVTTWTPVAPAPPRGHVRLVKTDHGLVEDGQCRNHLAHGYRENARIGHGDLCDWCQSVKAEYGVLPNASLIEARRNGVKRRLQTSDYERHLGVKRKAKKR